MRVPTVAFCTLAALTAWDLTREAHASQATPPQSPQPQAENFVVQADVITSTPIEAIAPPETLVAQQFSESSTQQNSEQSNGAQYYQNYQSAVVVPTEAVDSPAADTSTTPTAAPTQPIATTSSPTSLPAARVLPRPTANPTPAATTTATPAPRTVQAQTNRPSATDLVVTATDVQVVGASQELQQIVRNVIQTRPGGDTSQSQIQTDVDQILETGLFTDARANSRINSNGVSVTYQVTPVVVRSLQLSGATALTPQLANDFFKGQLGSTVSPAALTQGARQINQWYERNGYGLARVLSVRPSQNGVITVEVAEGVVGAVNIRFVSEEGKTVDEQGNPIRGRTKPEFIRQEIKLQPGAPFQESVVRQDLQQLSQLGLFQNAEVTLNGDSRKVDVTYNLTERPARAVNVGGGYSADSGVFGTINYRDQNVGGVGNQIGGNILAGTRGDIQFDGSFTSPYRASQPGRLGYKVDVFRRRSLSTTFDEFGGDNAGGDVDLPNGDRPREARLGGGVTFNRPLDDEWQGSLGLNYTRTSIRDSDGNITPTDEFGNQLSFSGTGIDDLTTVAFSATRDRRNSRVNPTEGSVLTLSTAQSIPIGQGSILSNRLQANYAQYVPVKILDSSDKAPEVLAFNLQGGTTIGDLPPYNAFNLGGPNSVRGYGLGDVGSGRSYVLASAEYRFPILSSPVTGVVFADFASDLGSGSTVPGEPAVVRGKPGTGFGYGVGVRVQSPIGIIRADYGFNDEGEDRLQFGLGQRF